MSSIPPPTPGEATGPSPTERLREAAAAQARKGLDALEKRGIGWNGFSPDRKDRFVQIAALSAGIIGLLNLFSSLLAFRIWGIVEALLLLAVAVVVMAVEGLIRIPYKLPSWAGMAGLLFLFGKAFVNIGAGLLPTGLWGVVLVLGGIGVAARLRDPNRYGAWVDLNARQAPVAKLVLIGAALCLLALRLPWMSTPPIYSGGGFSGSWSPSTTYNSGGYSYNSVSGGYEYQMGNWNYGMSYNPVGSYNLGFSLGGSTYTGRSMGWALWVVVALVGMAIVVLARPGLISDERRYKFLLIGTGIITLWWGIHVGSKPGTWVFLAGIACLIIAIKRQKEAVQP